jgi:hypothetical protein
MEYDLIVPLLESDLETFKRNMPYIHNNIIYRDIIVIGQQSIAEHLSDIEGIKFINEDTLYPGLTLKTVKGIKKAISGNERRSGWYFQQFLKMAYSRICQDDYYLIWDSDTIPVRPINFFNEAGQPYLDYIGYNKYDECYKVAQERLLPDNKLHKKEKKSFITEHMIIDKKIMCELLEELEANENGYTFYTQIMRCVPLNAINLSGFSEFETYAAYVLEVYPDKYALRNWKNLRNARVFIGDKLSDVNIKWLAVDYWVISIEEFDRQLLICKLLEIFDSNRKIPFRKVYSFLERPIAFKVAIRDFVRRLIKG